MNMLNRQQLREASAYLCRYGSAGAIASACHYLTFMSLLILLPPLWASVAGALVGSVVSFRCNRRWTFVSDTGKALAPKRFFLIAACHNLGNALLMKHLLSLDVIHPLGAQLAVSGLLFIVSFLIHRFWSYTYE